MKLDCRKCGCQIEAGIEACPYCYFSTTGEAPEQLQDLNAPIEESAQTKKKKISLWGFLGNTLIFTLIGLGGFILMMGWAYFSNPTFNIETQAADRAVAWDHVSQLNSAAAMYTAKQLTTPNGFMDFVTEEPIKPGDSFTLSTSTMGDGSCKVSRHNINCNNAFSRLSQAEYYWDNGAITAKIEY